MRFPSELQFSKEKLHSNLFAFADTCQYPLVALAAMINTNMNSYYLSHRPYYTKVLEDLHISMPSHPYTVGYNRMLQYHSGDSKTSEEAAIACTNDKTRAENTTTNKGGQE